jgi:hypothetical protein
VTVASPWTPSVGRVNVEEIGKAQHAQSRRPSVSLYIWCTGYDGKESQ